jgi:hypothetical protein
MIYSGRPLPIDARPCARAKQEAAHLLWSVADDTLLA